MGLTRKQSLPIALDTAQVRDYWSTCSEKAVSQEDIVSTGLLIKAGNAGNGYPEFFNKRLIFPYWKAGNVVYFIGRKTAKTPDKEWEQGKYKKLPVHSEDRPYISEFISNQYYYGEDSIRGKSKCFVAEGITDCLALLQRMNPAYRR